MAGAKSEAKAWQGASRLTNEDGCTRREASEPTTERPFGWHIQQVMAERHGCEMTSEEAADFARRLLRLVEIGALVPSLRGGTQAGEDVQSDANPR